MWTRYCTPLADGSSGGSRRWSLLLLALVLVQCGSERREEDRSGWLLPPGPPPDRAFQSRINVPSGVLGMFTGEVVAGQAVRIRCSTCHALMEPAREERRDHEVREFHRGVRLNHGDQTCRTCHHPPLFEEFHLSSGQVVIPYGEVMELCGQCHSRQYQDYKAGIHGGMAGYWDLDSGPRDRNHCMDCHDPHRPAYPKVLPAPRPRYRFMEEESHE